MNKKENWSFFISIVAITIALFSFGITEYELTYDKVNFLITVLAILVTALIGWQIFNVINFENRLSKLKNEAIGEFEDKVKKESEKITKLELDFTSKIEEINNKNNEYYTRIYYNLSLVLYNPESYGISFQSLIYAIENADIKNKKVWEVLTKRLSKYTYPIIMKIIDENINNLINIINNLPEEKKIEELNKKVEELNKVLDERKKY